MPEWWNGRHNRLKICRTSVHEGSTPSLGTNFLIIGVIMSKQFGTNNASRIIPISEPIKYPPNKKYKKKATPKLLTFDDIEIGDNFIGIYHDNDKSTCRCKCTIIDKYKLGKQTFFDQNEFIFCIINEQLDKYQTELTQHIFQVSINKKFHLYNFHSRRMIEFDKFI